MHDPHTQPELSVVIPTFGRPERVATLLARLDAQTLAPERFEVLLVDDGSPEPVTVESGAHRYSLRVLRQDNAGPAAARNLGVQHGNGSLVLFLNDDAVPAPDLLAGHIAAHAEETSAVAVMGSFPFSAEARKHPFVQVLEQSDLLFNFPQLRHGERHDWTFFWTCNISLSVERFNAVGGFDAETFPEAIVEDVELGFRLEKEGLQVLYREDLICDHEHVLDARSYFRRMTRLGVNLSRMYAKHGDNRILWCRPDQSVEQNHVAAMQSVCETFHDTFKRAQEKLERFESEYHGRSVPASVLDQVRGLVRRIGMVPFARGVLTHMEDHDPAHVIEHGPTKGRLTSVLIASCNALDQTKRCLEGLRRSAEADHPIEILFVDNGSDDGSAEYLAAQSDVRLIRNETNEGAPKARNQALAEARGDWIVFMDNDVIVTPGWLSRMLFHAEVDGRSGCVGCLADRAAHGQQIELTADNDPQSLQRFADEIAGASRRQAKPVWLLSSFLLLTRRSVVEAIGGFDEWFSPWGFEDDDYSLRARLAGFRNRLALDVFVRHEAYAGTNKAERHRDLLKRNWVRFANKWGLAASYGDYTGLENLAGVSWKPEELHVPFNEQTARGEDVLAWPDYGDPAGLELLLGAVTGDEAHSEQRQLVLRVDPALDGKAEAVVQAVERAYEQAIPPDVALTIQLIDDADAESALQKALLACDKVIATGSDKERSSWLARSGLATL